METVEVDVNKEIKLEVPWAEELLCDQRVASDDVGRLIAECPFESKVSLTFQISNEKI